LLSLKALDATLARADGRRGAPVLRRIADGVEPGYSNGRFEAPFLRLLRAHGLPEPIRNRKVDGILVDFHWPEQRLIVETDGKLTHDPTHGRRRDHRRDARHQLAGWRVLRFTYEELMEDPAYVIATIRAFLA
jgi:very-short-patch-repair endonuclease